MGSWRHRGDRDLARSWANGGHRRQRDEQATLGVGYGSQVLTGLFVVVVGIALGFGIHRRGFAGYPPAPAGLAVLHAGEAAFVGAVGEVLFPSHGPLALPGRAAQLPQNIDRHLAALPRAQRLQIRLLFGALEHLTLLVPGDEPGGRRRFSSLSAASRITWLQRLARHRVGLLRLLLTALRSVFVLGYLGHPANLQGLGLAPFEIEPVVSDAELLFPRVGGLVSSISFGPEDRNVDRRLPPLDPEGRRHRAYARAASGTTRSGA
jgi:hypothetical protein